MTGLGLDPRYDDADDLSNYCIHGNYTGTPWGADFLCGMCEDGLTRIVTCTECGFATWGTIGESFSSCEPNPERRSKAKFLREARNQSIADGTYYISRPVIQMGLDAFQGRVRRGDNFMPKRIHEWEENTND